MFLHVYGISKSRFQRLLEHYQNHGISLRVHGNSKRLPHNTLPQAIAEDVKNFLSNYTEENAVLLPGRIPGFKNEDIVLLSSSETKMHVWNCFKRACEVASKRVVSYTKFIELWKQFHPNLVYTKFIELWKQFHPNLVNRVNHSLRSNGWVFVDMGKTALAEICVDGCDVDGENSGSEVTNWLFFSNRWPCSQLATISKRHFLNDCKTPRENFYS